MEKGHPCTGCVWASDAGGKVVCPFNRCVILYDWYVDGDIDAE